MEFEQLRQHIGHNVVVVGYGQEETINASIECEDCNEVLYSVNKYTEEESNTVYILTEEWEGTDGIREFTILAVTNDKKLAKKKLNEEVKKDEYEYFKNKGFADDYDFDDEDCLCAESNFNDGFVLYRVSKQDVI